MDLKINAPCNVDCTSFSALTFKVPVPPRIKVKNANANPHKKAGKYKDSCVIYKVEQERPEYKVAKVDSSNWM